MAEDKKTSDRRSNAADDLGADRVQAAFDEANDKGFFGESPDKTPRENYTLKGVTSGKPTPETDRA
jgi:hypothetical protein